MPVHTRMGGAEDDEEEVKDPGKAGGEEPWAPAAASASAIAEVRPSIPPATTTALNVVDDIFMRGPPWAG